MFHMVFMVESEVFRTAEIRLFGCELDELEMKSQKHIKNYKDVSLIERITIPSAVCRRGPRA